MTLNADCRNGSPPTNVGKALLQVLCNPFCYVIQHWKPMWEAIGARHSGAIFRIAEPIWLWSLIPGRRRRERIETVILLGLLSIPPIAGAQAASANGHTALTTDEIVSQLVQQNQRRAALLKHYESCRFYSVDYAGFPATKSAAMVVDMTYDAPAQKQFRIVKEQGSKVLLDHVLHELIQSEKEATNPANLGRTDLTPSNYEFRLVGTDSIAGKPQYVLQVVPRSKSKYLYRGKIWVDANDFAVSHVAAHPAKNISFWISNTDIEHEYRKVGEFWLPSRNTSNTKVRFGGTAKLKIDYRDYRVGASQAGVSSDFCSPADTVGSLTP